MFCDKEKTKTRYNVIMIQTYELATAGEMVELGTVLPMPSPALWLSQMTGIFNGYLPIDFRRNDKSRIEFS